jgi:hypothetical protein
MKTILLLKDDFGKNLHFVFSKSKEFLPHAFRMVNLRVEYVKLGQACSIM